MQITTDDGLALHTRLWDVPGARGSVLLVHGLGEHLGRYEHVAGHLNTHGWRVAAYDQRGHGRSPGARGALARRDDLLRDLGRAVDAVRALPGPRVLLGHSLGGLVAARYAAEGLEPAPADWWRPVDALVLSSPALDPDLSPVQKLLLAVLGPLAPNVPLHNGLDPHWVSRDPAVVRAYRADPLVHDRGTPGLARFSVDAAAFVASRAARWRLPTLLMWAGADRCVAPRGSAAFAAAAPRDIVRSREWSGLAHEIFNEPEQHEVLNELTRWLDARTH